jgi:PIN domain nuclease of toxin-antitoxin system
MSLPSRLAVSTSGAWSSAHGPHALRVASLSAHHRDPFDRLLLAQTQLEGLVIMTSHAQFSAYAVEVIGP